MELPEELDALGAQTFMQELQPLLDLQRPRIIFDCSGVRYMDGVGVEMMRHCLEEARKRDGNLKLAALSPEAQVVLELMRDDRVFEAFATSDDAVQSFPFVPAKGIKISSHTHLNGELMNGELRILKKAS
jgi:anti-sigma B factor antagonist